MGERSTKQRKEKEIFCFRFHFGRKKVERNTSSVLLLLLINGESIGEIDRDEDTDERISLANDDEGERL